MNRFNIKLPIIMLLFFAIGTEIANCQTIVLDTLNMGTLRKQVETLENRTRTYDNYRAVREDYFQLFTKNALDSLNLEKQKNDSLNLSVDLLYNKIDSLNSVAFTLNMELEEAINTKDSIKFFGADLNKKVYGSIMWITVSILLFILIAGFSIFRKNAYDLHKTKDEHNNLLDEFETYKQKNRIEREKINVEHFREIQKLKGINK